MSFIDYGLPQLLDRKNVCFKPPKYAKVKRLIKFIKNSTLIGQFTFWQFKANFTATIDFTMIYTQWAERFHLPLYLIPLSNILPLLKFCSFPKKTLRLLQPLFQSKKLLPHFQCCSKTRIFEKGQLSGQERNTTELNFTSIQVQLTLKVKLCQLCTQDSKKNRQSRSFYRIPPFWNTPPPFRIPFLWKISPSSPFVNFLRTHSSINNRGRPPMLCQLLSALLLFHCHNVKVGMLLHLFCRRSEIFQIFQVSQNLPEYFLYGKYSGQKPLFLLEMVFRQKVEKRELNVTHF